MPRSSADRAFGFKSAGLVRILLAADPAEILKALSELGLVVQEPTTLFQQFGRLVADFLTAPFEGFIDQFEAAIPLLERVLQQLIEGHPRAEDDPAALRTASDLDTLIADLTAEAERVAAQQAIFRARLEALEAQTLEQVAITFL